MTPADYLPIAALAFLLGIVDASFGMGYGTLLTPVLLMLGFDPLHVVPAVLISQLAGDFLAALFHHRLKNVDLSFGSIHFKIAVTLAVLSIAGSVAAVLVAINLPMLYLSLYIGLSVTASGLAILAVKIRSRRFSWRRLFCLGSFAAFNKGISGGGWGPIVVASQILTGVDMKAAIGITTLSEGVICTFTVVTYFLVYRSMDWLLLALLSIGIALSTPFAALIVKRIESRKMKLIIGLFTITLGLLTVLKTLYL
jgi:uncharacterized membrane protein YfcA